MYQRKEEILIPQTVSLNEDINLLMDSGSDGSVLPWHPCDWQTQKRRKIFLRRNTLFEFSFQIFRCPTFDFFYSLQNISFCGAHPKELRLAHSLWIWVNLCRYFGFITKHPLLPRFACHVFLSNESTQAIVEGFGFSKEKRQNLNLQQLVEPSNGPTMSTWHLRIQRKTFSWNEQNEPICLLRSFPNFEQIPVIQFSALLFKFLFSMPMNHCSF